MHEEYSLPQGDQAKQMYQKKAEVHRFVNLKALLCFKAPCHMDVITYYEH